MATEITLAGSRREQKDLSHWMDRVLKELDKLRTQPDEHAVHDLRVALRRCRSLAAVMEEVDPHVAWPQMHKLARKLFRAIGELRDSQVLENWVKRLSAESDPLRQRLLESFKSEENEIRENALRIAEQFDQKKWKKAERQLRRRPRLVAAESPAAACLALQRFESAKDLHARALRTEKPKPWHELRIGLKRFRYTVESLLPAHHETWGNDLKHVQDLLGDVHDLDVLSDTILQLRESIPEESRDSWTQRITREREDRLNEYRELTQGKYSLWHEWREGLPQDRKLDAAVLARQRATARAMDRNYPRTALIANLSTRIYDTLTRVSAAAVFERKDLRRIMTGAARLHGIGSAFDSSAPQKAAREFLQNLDPPPSWSEAEWNLLCLVVRYHRGVQPKEKHKAFAKLLPADQAAISAMAGVLRLARVLRKCGIVTAKGLRLEKSVDAILISAAGLGDSEEIAARLAVGKHLLETVVGRPVILRALPVAGVLLQLPQQPSAFQQSAAASD
jgi:CHAD domain-containing protein